MTRVTEKYIQLIRDRVGLNLSNLGGYQVEKRIKAIANSLELSIDELEAKFSSLSDQEINLIINLSTNNETFFFRDRLFFDSLGELFNRNEHQVSNVWIPALSTGQEFYSVYMKLKEVLSDVKLSLVSFDCSDINTEVVEYAKKGHYTKLECSRGLGTEVSKDIGTYDENNGFQFSSWICQKFNAFSHNILEPRERNYDLIISRNVLIYFDGEHRKQAEESLYSSLSANGILILGSGERPSEDLFSMQSFENGYNYFLKK